MYFGYWSKSVHWKYSKLINQVFNVLFPSYCSIKYRKPGWLWIPGNFDHFKVFFVQPLAELILYNDIEKFYTICKAWLFSMSLSEINSVKECMKKIKSGPSYPVFKVTPVYGNKFPCLSIYIDVNFPFSFCSWVKLCLLISINLVRQYFKQMLKVLWRHWTLCKIKCTEHVIFWYVVWCKPICTF